MGNGGLAMVNSVEFCLYIEDQLKAFKGVKINKMFGGAGLFRDNLMFGLIADDIVYLKADETSSQDFVAREMPQFQPFADKPMKMPYWEVPADIVEDDEEFVRWANSAFQVALKSPSKKKKARPHPGVKKTR